MKLVSVALARVIAMVQFDEWDPFGRTLTFEAISNVASRYSFAKVPTKPEELDLQKGVELVEGRFDDVRIDKVTIYINGIAVDTRSSTDDSERVLNDIFQLASDAFGAAINPARKSFASQLIFRSEMRLATLNPVLPRIADLLTERASANLKHPFVFEPTAILVGADTSQAKVAPVVFSIERRAELPFSENTYFSNAPLATKEHLETIQAFETALLD